MRIDRCLCHGVAFAALAEAADASGAETVPELQRHAAFGRGCGLCRPYVRRMLRTGQTVFREVVTEADEPAALAPDLAEDDRQREAGRPRSG